MTTHSPTVSLPLPAAATASRPRLARGAVHAARVALGLLFFVFVFGLNGFLLFIPAPSEPLPEAAMAFTCGLEAAGDRLALTILAPVVLNIVLFPTSCGAAAWARRRLPRRAAFIP